MGSIYRELLEEAEERRERVAFEEWMRRRGTPLMLEQTQAFEAFRAGIQWAKANAIPISSELPTTSQATVSTSQEPK